MVILWLQGMHLKGLQEVSTAIESSSTDPGRTRPFPCFLWMPFSPPHGVPSPKHYCPFCSSAASFLRFLGCLSSLAFLDLAHSPGSPAGGLCSFCLPGSMAWWVIAVRQAQVHSGCVALGKFLNFSEFLLAHLYWGGGSHTHTRRN